MSKHLSFLYHYQINFKFSKAIPKSQALQSTLCKSSIPRYSFYIDVRKSQYPCFYFSIKHKAYSRFHTFLQFNLGHICQPRKYQFLHQKQPPGYALLKTSPKIGLHCRCFPEYYAKHLFWRTPVHRSLNYLFQIL